MFLTASPVGAGKWKVLEESPSFLFLEGEKMANAARTVPEGCFK